MTASSPSFSFREVLDEGACNPNSFQRGMEMARDFEGVWISFLAAATDVANDDEDEIATARVVDESLRGNVNDYAVHVIRRRRFLKTRTSAAASARRDAGSAIVPPRAICSCPDQRDKYCKHIVAFMKRYDLLNNEPDFMAEAYGIGRPAEGSRKRTRREGVEGKEVEESRAREEFHSRFTRAWNEVKEKFSSREQEDSLASAELFDRARRDLAARRLVLSVLSSSGKYRSLTTQGENTVLSDMRDALSSLSPDEAEWLLIRAVAAGTTND